MGSIPIRPLAFDPDTGKLVWYFQHVHNDQWDLDWAFERQVIPMNVNGTVKKVIVTGGKQGIYDVLEADTGKYVFSKDLGLQNVVSSIDPKTGAKTINPAVVPGDGKIKLVCPHAGGGRSWIPTLTIRRRKSSIRRWWRPAWNCCRWEKASAAGSRPASAGRFARDRTATENSAGFRR